MLGRIRPVLRVMTMFWLTFLAFAWFVANIYLPVMEQIFNTRASIPATIFVWLIVVVLLALMLVLFRNILQGIFYRELSKLNENRDSVSNEARPDG